MAVAKVQYMKKTKEQKDSCRVVTPKGRLSYPFLFEPSEGEDGKRKYRTQLLVPKKNKDGEDIDFTKINTAIRNCKTIVWGKDKTKWPKNLGSPIRDGDGEDFKEENSKGKMVTKPGYKGMWVISASSNEQAQPKIIDVDKEEITVPSDVYAGCYARLQLIAQEWTWKKKQGIMFVLDGVQKLADGEPFGEKRSAKDMFNEELSDEDLEDLEGDDDDSDDNDDEDDAPPKKKSTKKKSVDDDDEDGSDDSDDEEDSDEDLDDEDSDDDDEDEEPVRKKKTTKKKRPVDDDEDDE